MTSSTHTLLRCAWTLSLVLLCTGCSLIRMPKVGIPGGPTAIGHRDAGTPAVVTSDTDTTTFDAPAGSTMTAETHAAVPATNTTPTIPEYRIVKWTFPAPTRVTTTDKKDTASTGTIDTTVAKHRIDVEDRRVLLYASMICGALGLIARIALKEWPTAGNALLLASALAFASWKLAEIPTWLWVLVLVVAGAVILGYKRAEWDANGDGIPDALQRKPQSPTS